MGLRIELIIIVSAVAILLIAMNTEMGSTKANKHMQNKEMEFTNTTLREVDTNISLSVSYGTYGIRESGVLTIDNLRYHTDNIKLLTARQGRYKGDLIFLDYNVTVHKEEGSDYYAEHAVYNQKSSILVVNSPFIAIKGKNIMHGNHMVYDANKKVLYATEVDADLYTTKK